MKSIATYNESVLEHKVKPVVLDRDEVFRRAMEDVDLLEGVFDLFLEDYPDRLRCVNESIEQGDAAALRSSAHVLKGALGNLAAKAACETAHQLEKSGAESSLAAAPKLIAQVQDQVVELELEFESFVRSLKTTSSGTV